jgi:2'-5' RNA ligase
LRLFVALELPPAVRNELVRWQVTELAQRPALRLVDRDALHVTLCFLGPVAPSAVAAVRTALDRVTGAPAAPLALGAAVWLPRRRPRVLAVTIDDDDGRLRDLQAQVAAILVAAGVYEPEPRLFFPHVTAARVRSEHRVRGSPLSAPAPVEFIARTVTLYRSWLSVGPARYEALHRAALDPE